MCFFIPPLMLRCLATAFGTISVIKVIGILVVLSPHTSLDVVMTSDMKDDITSVGHKLAELLNMYKNQTGNASCHPDNPNEKDCGLIHVIKRYLGAVISFILPTLYESIDGKSNPLVYIDETAVMHCILGVAIFLGIVNLIMICGSMANHTCLLCPALLASLVISIGSAFLLFGIGYNFAVLGYQFDKFWVNAEFPWLSTLLKGLMVELLFNALKVAILCVLGKQLHDKTIINSTKKIDVNTLTPAILQNAPVEPSLRYFE